MAGLYRLKILLLWAGLAALAISQDPQSSGTNNDGSNSTDTDVQVPNTLPPSTNLTTTTTTSPPSTNLTTTTLPPSTNLTTTITNLPPSTNTTTTTTTTTTSPPSTNLTTTTTNLPPSTNPTTTTILPPSTNLTTTITNLPPSTNPTTTTTTTTTILPPRTSSPALLSSHPSLDSTSNANIRMSTLASTTTRAGPPSPSSTPATTPAVSPSNTTENQISLPSTTTSQNQTLPATTQSTTIAPTTPSTTTTGPCTVKPVRFGFQIQLANLTDGEYIVELTEEETGSKKEIRRFNHTANSTEPSPLLKYLKPCTNYELHVTFINTNTSVTLCKQRVVTIEMVKNDFDFDNCGNPAHVCYWSDWDISSARISGRNYPPAKLPCNSNHTYQRGFCTKPSIDDICSVLTTTITSKSCSVNLTADITLDSLDPSEIERSTPTQLPVEIEWLNEPKRCNESLSIDYTCKEQDGYPLSTIQSKKLDELEPYKLYNCTGQIKPHNISTHDVSVEIDCGVRINITSDVSRNSIKMKWKTTMDNCPPAELKNLSYHCCCGPPAATPHKEQMMLLKCVEETKGNACQISGLDYWTDYICQVQPKYNTEVVSSLSSPNTIKKKTGVGRPVGVPKPHVILTEHNAVVVKCDENSIKWNGPQGMYEADLDGIKKTNGTCYFEFTSLSYLTAYTVRVIAFNGEYRSEPSVGRDFSTRYDDKAVIGILSFLIILTAVALLFVLYKIYIVQQRKSHNISESMDLIPVANDEDTLLNIEPIAAENLLDSYKRKIADDGRLFLAEFQSVPRIFTRNSVKEAKKPCNAIKNRYMDILPYDFNRVQLTSGNGAAGCDYINASVIDGYNERKKYIAAQGPKEETMGDFWRMVWEQQSSIIVMVTRSEEGNRIKCAQYWPTTERGAEIFEEFVVKLNGEDHCPDYIIRHLSLSNKRDKNTEREVTHIQFTSWPDHDVPAEPHLLLKLRRRINAFKNFFSGPIVIHCSAGVGRTGTYISIDAMMEGLEVEGRVDIYGYIVRLRRQRCFMVQVEAQYILIHRALIDFIKFGETEIPLSELHSTLSTLRQTGSGTEPTLLEEEFQRLPRYTNWRTFNTGITEENKKKNRVTTVIPYDFNRVLVKLVDDSSHDSDHDGDDEDESSDEEDEESTKYINASYIDGYWCPLSFIATQGPLPDTIADFWQMVYQKKAKAIVMLSDCNEDDTEMCSPYWGSEKKTFGDIEVEVTATETSSTFTTRTMLIRHAKRKESRQVKQFHFLKWTSREVPEKPQDLTDMIKNIKQTCGYGNSKSDRSTPVVVHCSDGSSRSSVFCALWNLLDSAETEKLVDVFQVSKALRMERQDNITSQEQYHFLYDALEGAFPVQNGDVKAAINVATDSVQMVNETKTGEPLDETQAEKQAEQPASSTALDEQGAAENTPLVADGAKEEEKKEEEKEEGTAKEPPTEKMPSEETSNGPIVTLEV